MVKQKKCLIKLNNLIGEGGQENSHPEPALLSLG